MRLQGLPLLNRECEPVTNNTQQMLMDRVYLIGKWSIKGVEQEYAALRVGKLRMNEMKRRMNFEDGNLEYKGMVRMLASYLYSHVLSQTTKRHIATTKTEATINDIDLLMEAVKSFVDIEENPKPTRMDVGSFEERHSDA